MTTLPVGSTRDDFPGRYGTVDTRCHPGSDQDKRDPIERGWRGDPAELVAGGGDLSTLLDRIARARPSWHSTAACAGISIDVFFPGPGAAPRQALEICGRCPVRDECLAEAIADPTLDYGVRGGMTAQARIARRRLARRRGDGMGVPG